MPITTMPAAGSRHPHPGRSGRRGRSASTDDRRARLPDRLEVTAAGHRLASLTILLESAVPWTGSNIPTNGPMIGPMPPQPPPHKMSRFLDSRNSKN